MMLHLFFGSCIGIVYVGEAFFVKLVGISGSIWGRFGSIAWIGKKCNGPGLDGME
jgi:hypothetical protein